MVVDFGIARDLAAESATEGIGTPGYMAPEAFMGGPLSPHRRLRPRHDHVDAAHQRSRALRERAAAGGHEPRRCSRPSTRRWPSTPSAGSPSMQAFADGLGGRLPTERGRDIGVAAAVGEATARVLFRRGQDRRGVFDAAATSIALRRPDGGLDYQAAWGAGADEVVGMHLAPGPGDSRPGARHRRRRGHPGLPQRPRLRRRDRAPAPATCPTR